MTTSRRAAIVAPVRTPVGTFGGSLRAVPVEELAAVGPDEIMYLADGSVRLRVTTTRPESGEIDTIVEVGGPVAALWSRGERVRALVGSSQPRPELTALSAEVVATEVPRADELPEAKSLPVAKGVLLLAFLARAVHIVGKRRWNRRGAMVTDRYQHVRHHRTVAELDVDTVTVRARGDIIAAMWEKFAFIASLAGLTCLMRGSIGEIVATPERGALF